MDLEVSAVDRKEGRLRGKQLVIGHHPHDRLHRHLPVRQQPLHLLQTRAPALVLDVEAKAELAEVVLDAVRVVDANLRELSGETA
eukprot:348262-Hanusia_phi.AAC.2